MKLTSSLRTFSSAGTAVNCHILWRLHPPQPCRKRRHCRLSSARSLTAWQSLPTSSDGQLQMMPWSTQKGSLARRVLIRTARCQGWSRGFARSLRRQDPAAARLKVVTTSRKLQKLDSVLYAQMTAPCVVLPGRWIGDGTYGCRVWQCFLLALLQLCPRSQVCLGSHRQGAYGTRMMTLGQMSRSSVAVDLWPKLRATS